MRSAVDAILKYNRGFHVPSLRRKLQKMAASPFPFFRATFHLFAQDVETGPFRKWPCLDARGPIIGDLHTENFGTFRAINKAIVYDVNDFDETTKGPYEYDLRRLATSLILDSCENQHSLAEGALAAESCLHGYLDTLARFEKLRTRADFEHLKEHSEARRILVTATEKSRAGMMAKLAVESSPGVFVLQSKDNFLPVSAQERTQALGALPMFLKTCLAPKGAEPARYTFQDIAFRIAGCGSLGRRRYAVLLGKGQGRETFETLRLMEWKASYDSALDTPKPRQSKGRAKDILKATLAFQVLPKRYLGYTSMDGMPMQAREIGANDLRFNSREFADLDRFKLAARLFGDVTARTHLVSTLGKTGVRALSKELAGGKQDRWVKRMVAFAVAYTDQVLDDYAEYCARREEVARKWSVLDDNHDGTI